VSFLAFLFKCLWFLLPAALSNHNASVGNRLWGPRFLKLLIAKLDVPIDLGYKLNGKEIFGRNKTFRGFAIGVTTGILVAALQYFLYVNFSFFRDNTLLDYTKINFVLVGFLMGFGALFGDLVKSFIKRQLGKRPGLPWFPFDQLDWILMSMIFTAIVYFPPLDYFLGTVVIYLLVHLCSDQIVQRMGIKKKEDVYFSFAEMRLIRSLLFWFFCGAVVVVVWVIALLTKIFRLDPLPVYQVGRFVWTKILLWSGGIKVKVEGYENVPSRRPLIFAANHQSYMDIFVLMEVLPFRFRFVTWDVLFRIPFLGDIMRDCGHIPIPDDNAKEALITILKTAEVVLAGDSIVIFPEGRLTRDGKLGPFGRGVAMIALKTETPVIPIAISGSFEVLPKGEWILKPNLVRVKIGKPLFFDCHTKPGKEAYVKATKEIRNSIAGMLAQEN